MSTVSLDSFQLIVGLYLAYVSIKGSGTLYNFFDLSKADQKRVRIPLRLIYGLCSLIALAEAALCIWQGGRGYDVLSLQTVNTISSVMTALIILILVLTFIWLRSLANKQ